MGIYHKNSSILLRIVSLTLSTILIFSDVCRSEYLDNNRNLAVPGSNIYEIQANLKARMAVRLIEDNSRSAPDKMSLRKIEIGAQALKSRFPTADIKPVMHQSDLVEIIIRIDDGLRVRYYDPQLRPPARNHHSADISSAIILEHLDINPALSRETLIDRKAAGKVLSGAEESIRTVKKLAEEAFTDMDYHPVNNPYDDRLSDRIEKCIRLLSHYRDIATRGHISRLYAGKSLRDTKTRKTIQSDDMLKNIRTIESTSETYLLSDWDGIPESDRASMLDHIGQAHLDYLVVNRLVNEIDEGMLKVMEKLLEVELRRETTDEAKRQTIMSALPYVADPDMPTTAVEEDANRFQRHLTALSAGRPGWGSASGVWAIDRLVYIPAGIRKSGLVNSRGERVYKDEFNNYPHWIYVIRNTETEREVFVGPDDVKTIFPDRSEEISGLMKRKKEEISSRRERLRRLLTFGHRKRLSDETLAELKEIAGRRAIGDEDFVVIDREYSILSDKWGEKHPELPLDTFMNNLSDLKSLMREIGERRLSFLGESEIKDAHRALSRVGSGFFPSNKEVRLLRGLHARLLALQNQMIIESTYWARRQAVAIDPAQQARTPAYHANLWIANYLTSVFKGPVTGKMIMDAGSNMSVLWSILRHSSSEPAKKMAGNVIDLEREADIWGAAPNPHKVCADISKLPEIEDSSDARSARLIRQPGSFSAIVSSFMLDQLTSEELRGALRSFQACLKDGPGTALSADNISEFPLLIIASPKQSPVEGSPFASALKTSGFTLVTSRFMEGNRLSTDAEERITREGRRDDVRLVRSLAEKGFHIAVYAKTEKVDAASLNAIRDELLSLRQGGTRKPRRGAAEKAGSLDRLNPEVIFALDIIARLKPEDFDVEMDQAVVSRYSIRHEDRFMEFERNLAILIHYRSLLPPRERRELSRIVAAWSDPDTSFLSSEDVKFVMELPSSAKIKHTATSDLDEPLFRAKLARILRDDMDTAFRHLNASSKLTGRAVTETSIRREEARVQREKTWRLIELSRVEDEARMEGGRGSILETERPGLPVRVAKIRSAVAQLKKDKTTPNLARVAEIVGLHPSALRSWAERRGIDLIALGMEIEGAFSVSGRINEVRAAVAAIIEEGVRPNLARVAVRLGADPGNLRTWAQRVEVDLTEHGVIIEEDVDIDRRIEDIKAAVEAIRSEGGAPNLVNVAKRIGLGEPSALKNWANKYHIDLTSHGVMIEEDVNRGERITEIISAVEELKAEGKIPSLNAVAKRAKLDIGALTRWAIRENVNLEDYGVKHVEKARRIQKVRDAVDAIKADGEAPDPAAVEERAGFNIGVWARNSNIDLTELGVVMKEDGGAPTSAERTEFIGAIDKAVASLKAKKMACSGKNVAEEIGSSRTGKKMTYKNLLVLAGYHHIDLRAHGVELRSVSIDDRLAKISNIVDEIIAGGGVPTTEAVGQRIFEGNDRGRKLRNWAKYNHIELTEYGVVMNAPTSRRGDRNKADVESHALPGEEELTGLDVFMRAGLTAGGEQGRKLYLSENLFRPEDAARLKAIFDPDKIEVTDPASIRARSTNRETATGTIGCIVTRDDLSQYWDTEARRAGNKAAMLAVDIDRGEESRDMDFAYIYVEGLLGLVSAMADRDKDRDTILKYMEMLFEKAPDPSVLDEYMRDNDSIRLLMSTVLKLKKSDRIDVQKLDLYKTNVDTLLLNA